MSASGNAVIKTVKDVQTGTAVQTINFADVPAQTAGSTYALSVNASSGLPVGLFSQAPAVCSVAGSIVDSLASGTCTVLASQPGNTYYAAATPVSNSFSTHALDQQTIAFPAIGAQSVNVSITLSAQASSGLAVTYATSTPSVCTLNGSVLTTVGSGVCSVTASQAGGGIYAAATPVTKTANVGQVSQTITFPTVGPQVINTSLAMNATASSGMPVAYTVIPNGNCSVSGNVVTFLNYGNCGVVANQSGNASFTAAAAVGMIIPVTQPQAQTITFNAIPSQKIGTSLTVSATASSGLPVTFTVVQNGNCSVSGNVVTFLNYGNCGIIANQSGNASYTAAPAVGEIVPVIN